MSDKSGSQVDLNAISEVLNQAVKDQMGSTFEQNRLKPGDAGYQYDVRADFASPTVDNDWDDSEDECEDLENDDADLLDFLREEKQRSVATAVTTKATATVAAVATLRLSLIHI